MENIHSMDDIDKTMFQSLNKKETEKAKQIFKQYGVNCYSEWIQFWQKESCCLDGEFKSNDLRAIADILDYLNGKKVQITKEQILKELKSLKRFHCFEIKSKDGEYCYSKDIDTLISKIENGENK